MSEIVMHENETYRDLWLEDMQQQTPQWIPIESNRQKLRLEEKQQW